jgi:ADP-heptose:LPS heptosyltransferase
MGRAETIVVMVVAGIGDLVLATPALRALRLGHPDARIHLMTNTQALPLAKNLPYVTKTWPFPVRDIIRDKKKALAGAATLARLRALKPDVCVNLFKVRSKSGAARMKAAFAVIGAAVRVGHDSFGFGSALTVKAPEDFFSGRHVCESMLEMAKLAGGIPDGAGPDVFWDAESEEKWRGYFDELGKGGAPVVGINPGGDRRTKRLGADKFAAAASAVAKDRGAGVVVFGGPGEEAAAAAVCSLTTHPTPANLAGKLSLSDLAYALSRTDLLITTDSGPMHIAAAAGASVACVFGPDDPTLTRPVVPEGRSRVIKLDRACSPCFKSDCERPSCMEDIPAKDIARAALELLDIRRAAREAAKP